MEEEHKLRAPSHEGTSAEEASEAVELVLFHVHECYVYLIPPRMSAASYRADEWNVNKWAWEGSLKVVSKGEECIIKLEDRNTGELYARAFLRKGEPHPVEPVIDSSRYFVLRIEENIGGRLRHAFIGVGFRERSQAYDFQAALHDHMKYLDKKRTAEEMEQHFQSTPSVDYSLKEGETLVLQIKNKGNCGSKSTVSEQDISNISLEESSKTKLATVSLKPPPPPPAAVSSVNSVQIPNSTVDLQSKEPSSGSRNETDTVEDDFGDFQAAG
uniref:Adaptin ear-binding coat-associated protein 2 n=1 Tax=Anthurium amnicola TaxID=1678845 RepID=A0A1D1Y749_9ARAE